MEPAPEPERTVSRGAEARLAAVEWLGLEALRKDRDEKAYRPKALDERLRRERTRAEVRLLAEARKLGVRTPIVYDVDLPHHRIILEALPGPTLRELLAAHADDPEALAVPLATFGRAVGRLHAGGLSHGDLTSSNVIFPEGGSGPAALIDLSMGERNAGIEERGIDLHLVEEDLLALHPKGDGLYRTFLEGYAEGNPAGAEEVRRRSTEIKGRMRYV